MPNSDTHETPADQVEILRRLQNIALNRAKRWAGIAITIQLALFVLGVLAVFVPSASLTCYPWIGIPVALGASFVAGHAARLRSTGESLKRQHELADGLGRLPSHSHLADVQHDLGNSLCPKLAQLLAKGVTYDSARPVGPARVLENLVESSWYSKHLAKYVGGWLLITFILCLVISIAALLWCLVNLHDSVASTNAAKCIAATLLFMLSVGLIRSYQGYTRFAEKCGTCESQATEQLKVDPGDLYQAQRLLSEYQLARAGAPMIPTWIWKHRRQDLERDWSIKRKAL